MRSGPIIRGGIRRRFGCECMWPAFGVDVEDCTDIALLLFISMEYGVQRLKLDAHRILTRWIVLFWLCRCEWGLTGCGASSIASVVHMEHQHTTHIVTCGKSIQIHKKIRQVEVLWLRRTRGTLDSRVNQVHPCAIRIKMPYNILCYSRRRVRSKNGGLWLDTGDYFLFPSL